MTRRH